MRITVLRKRFAAAFGLVLFAVGWVAPVWARDVAEVLARVRGATAPGKDMRATFDFEIVNSKGESVHWTGSYYHRSVPDERLRLVIDSPIDLRGTEVTVTPDRDGVTHQRLYVPSLRRVRDLQADMRGESFLGTDFNYEDLGIQQLDFQQHTLIEGKDREGRDCFLLESVPQAGWWYGRIVRCIDRKTYLPLRTDYYDRSGVLWKIRTLEGIKTIQSHPTPTVITMQTVPARTLTRITLSDIQYDTGLTDVLFEAFH
jgi:outer membrane lipoprotein-sorting protein